jgi:outer membrane protein TolC
MSRPKFYSMIVGLTLLTALGCRPQQPHYIFDQGGGSEFIPYATRIEYPNVEIDPIPDVTESLSPFTLRNQAPEDVPRWDLTLEEAVRTALENSRVMRNLGGVSFSPQGTMGKPEALLRGGGAAATMYDPALATSDPRYGLEAALAAFDGQFTNSVFWSKGDAPQNYQDTAVNVFRRETQQTDVGNFQWQLAQVSPTGGQYSLSHSWQYQWDNLDVAPAGIKKWENSWTTNFEASISQPLLQGAGTGFNRIAGPGAVPGFYNGVVIARIREDISLADFEASVRNLVSDVEQAYWQLHGGYRQLDSARKGRDSSLQTWRQTEARAIVGHTSPVEEAQSRQQYYMFQTQTERALSDLYKRESLLRYIMGVATADGRLILPTDQLILAETDFDSNLILSEGLVRSVELRRQRWTIKQRELELRASKNFLLPRLDFEGKYRFLGMENDLMGQGSGNAFADLATGDHQEWEMGISLTVPIGFRRELAGVRNAEMQLAKARSILHEQELELSHNLGDAVRDLDRHYSLCQLHYNRILAAQAELQSTTVAEENGMVTLDAVLDAQRRLAEAETDYYNELVNHALAITQVHYRKGSLLEYRNVNLAEGPWPEKAYFDATRLARRRENGRRINFGFSMPGVISRGALNQQPGNAHVPVETGPVPEMQIPSMDFLQGGAADLSVGTTPIMDAITPGGSYPAPEGAMMTAPPAPVAMPDLPLSPANVPYSAAEPTWSPTGDVASSELANTIARAVGVEPVAPSPSSVPTDSSVEFASHLQ